jgi:hypothetical protein
MRTVAERLKRLLPVSWTHEVDPATGEPMHANMQFGEHRTQAMSMDPDDWMALNELPALIEELVEALEHARDLLMQSPHIVSHEIDAIEAALAKAHHPEGEA